MDSSRSVVGLLMLALHLAAPLPGAEFPTKHLLKSKHQAGELSRVELRLQVGGDLKLVAEGQSKNLPMSVVAKLSYDEHLLALDDLGRPSRSVRYYDEARAVIKVDKGGEKPSLDAEHRLIAVQKRPKSPALLFCPDGALKREELDLIDVPGNSLLTDALLPTEPVALGQAWKLDDQALADLLGLDAVSWTDVESVLGEVKDDLADITAAGSVSGAVGGVSTEIELKIKYKFDFKQTQVVYLALLVKEKRAVGHVGPGLDTVAKLIMIVSPLTDSKHLTPEAIAKVPASVTPELSSLSYTGVSRRFSFDYDRRWYLTSDDAKLAIFRLLDRGELVAQCNLSAFGDDRKTPVTLAEFQRDVQQSLGKNFTQFVNASEDKSAAGYTVLRVVAQGTVSQLPIAWIYYLVSNDKGQRVSLAFTFEQELEPRFAKADRALVSQLKLLEPPSPTTAKPAAEPGPTAARATRSK